MALVESEIKGRTGVYSVTITDRNSDRSPLEVGLQTDVVIRFGELDRSPVQQILKSYVQLAFVDEGLTLHKEFRGAFDRERYVVQISGPGVNWNGLIREETRTIPFEGRVQVESTVLNCYGGLTAGRLAFPDFTQGGRDEQIFKAYVISDFTSQLPIPSTDEGERIRSDMTLTQRDGTDQKVGQVASPEQDDPINLYRAPNAYEGLKGFGKISKGILYRSLSDQKWTWDAARYVGSGGDFKAKDPGDSDYSLKTRPSFIHDVDELLVGRDEDGLRDLARVGRVVVRFDSEQNIGLPGAVDKDAADTVHWRYDETNQLGEHGGTDATKDILVEAGQDGNQHTTTLYLGEITPENTIGIAVTWDTDDVVSTPEVELVYNGNSTFSDNIPDASSNSDIIGDEVTDAIDPVVKVTGSSSSIYLKIRYLVNGKYVEELVSSAKTEGVDEVVIENWIPPLVKQPQNNFEVEPLFLKNKDLSITRRQPFLYQTLLEREYRPFGTQTARGKLWGVYGPEYVHKIPVGGTETYFVATGLGINLNTGITDAALVEVPIHTLS